MVERNTYDTVQLSLPSSAHDYAGLIAHENDYKCEDFLSEALEVGIVVLARHFQGAEISIRDKNENTNQELSEACEDFLEQIEAANKISFLDRYRNK